MKTIKTQFFLLNSNKNEYQKSICEHKVKNVGQNVGDKKLSVEQTQGIHQNSENWLLSSKIFLEEITLRLFKPFSVFMVMFQRCLRRLRKLLQTKKFITNSPLCVIVCCIATVYHQ